MLKHFQLFQLFTFAKVKTFEPSYKQHVRKSAKLTFGYKYLWFLERSMQCPFSSLANPSWEKIISISRAPCNSILSEYINQTCHNSKSLTGNRNWKAKDKAF